MANTAERQPNEALEAPPFSTGSAVRLWFCSSLGGVARVRFHSHVEGRSAGSAAIPAARLAGIEPSARGFEGWNIHHPTPSRNVPFRHSLHGYEHERGRRGTRRTGRDVDLCHARATVAPKGTIRDLMGHGTQWTEIQGACRPRGLRAGHEVAHARADGAAHRRAPGDGLPPGRARRAARGPRRLAPARRRGRPRRVPATATLSNGVLPSQPEWTASTRSEISLPR